MDPSRTITEIKLSFIRDQIRLLTAPLDPSPDWRDYAPRVEEDLDDKTVNDVLEKCTLMTGSLFILYRGIY